MVTTKLFDVKFDEFITSSVIEEDFINIKYKFDNGYGASVIRNEYSYGGSEGLFELAVLDKDGYLNYETVITNDVLGWLSIEDVNETLEDIQSL